MLDSHIGNAFKLVPLTLPPTIGWNSTMTLNDILDQLMVVYGKSTPNTMHQNNLNFLAPYNPQDPPELLFKWCANCQEIVILMKVPYTDKQLLMNLINLLTRCGMYMHNMKDWDRKPDTDKTWLHLHPFIQTAYQRHLQTVPLRQHKEGTPTGLQTSPWKVRSLAMTQQRTSWGQSTCTWQTYPRLLHPLRPT